MRTPQSRERTILVSHSADVRDWVQEFERQASIAGFEVLSANQLRDSPPDLIRGLRSSEFVLAVVDPDSTSNTPLVEFVVGAAIGLLKTVWLVTPEPPGPRASAPGWFEELKSAVGAHFWGSPGETLQRLDWLADRSHERKAS
jgi:hypothetical protein